MTAERAALTHYLDAQRDSVLAIVDGLDEAALRRVVVPSGWTPLGLVAHLCGAERYWFQRVLTGELLTEQSWSDDWAGAGWADAASGPAVDLVITTYRQLKDFSNGQLARFDLDDEPAGTWLPWHDELASSVRSVVLHMIEETARHAGHLDIAREFLDGTTGLGPR